MGPYHKIYNALGYFYSTTERVQFQSFVNSCNNKIDVVLNYESITENLEVAKEFFLVLNFSNHKFSQLMIKAII